MLIFTSFPVSWLICFLDAAFWVVFTCLQALIRLISIKVVRAKIEILLMIFFSVTLYTIYQMWCDKKRANVYPSIYSGTSSEGNSILV